MAETKFSLKLLVDSKANKVLFAEAGQEFVDFLFHILSLPVGTVVRLLNEIESGMVGSVGSLYKSVESLSSDYFQASYNIYVCSDCYEYGSHDPNSICPECSNRINTKLMYAPPQSAANIGTTSNATVGYVKGVVTYMVMDNLEVKHMSTISGITLMNKFNVKDVSVLVEKEVQVGFTEGLAMLKASFEVTNSVLTTVFLGKNKA